MMIPAKSIQVWKHLQRMFYVVWCQHWQQFPRLYWNEAINDVKFHPRGGETFQIIFLWVNISLEWGGDNKYNVLKTLKYILITPDSTLLCIMSHILWKMKALLPKNTFTLLRVHFDVVKMLRSQRGSVMTFQFCVWVVQFGIVTLKLGVRIL